VNSQVMRFGVSRGPLPNQDPPGQPRLEERLPHDLEETPTTEDPPPRVLATTRIEVSRPQSAREAAIPTDREALSTMTGDRLRHPGADTMTDRPGESMRTGVVLHDLPTARTDRKERPSVRGADMMTDLPGESTRTDVVLHDLPTAQTDLKVRLSVRGADTMTGLQGESTRTDVVLHNLPTAQTDLKAH